MVASSAPDSQQPSLFAARLSQGWAYPHLDEVSVSLTYLPSVASAKVPRPSRRWHLNLIGPEP